MAAVVGVNVVMDQLALRALLADEWARGVVAGFGEQVAARARAAAPVRARGSRGGAASIHAETVMEHGEWVARVSWAAEHEYMRYPNSGTRYVPAKHFLQNALSGSGSAG